MVSFDFVFNVYDKDYKVISKQLKHFNTFEECISCLLSLVRLMNLFTDTVYKYKCNINYGDICILVYDTESLPKYDKKLPGNWQL